MNLWTLPASGSAAERRLDFTVEPARAAHLQEMAEIYREQAMAGLGSFEDPLPDAAELGSRLEAVAEAGLPAYVAVDGDDRVLGFCWARPFRAIAAYRATVEDSIHVASDVRRHGVARALEKFDPGMRPALKRGGFLTRDARKKERKKYGQRGARARFQFSKR